LCNQAARRIASSRLNHSAIWFQLAKNWAQHLQARRPSRLTVSRDAQQRKSLSRLTMRRPSALPPVRTNPAGGSIWRKIGDVRQTRADAKNAGGALSRSRRPYALEAKTGKPLWTFTTRPQAQPTQRQQPPLRRHSTLCAYLKAICWKRPTDERAETGGPADAARPAIWLQLANVRVTTYVPCNAVGMLVAEGKLALA
jgi:hypothetical protein